MYQCKLYGTAGCDTEAELQEILERWEKTICINRKVIENKR